MEGVVGFAVIYKAKYSAYAPTLPLKALVFERLTSEVARVANGPLNLFEALDLTIYYRKVLTRKFPLS